MILKVKAKYPHLKSKSKAAKKVNTFFANQIKKDIKEIKKLAEKDYSNIIKNKNSSDYYKYNENIKLTYNKKNKYSFKSNCSGYTGGVHGYSSVTGYNFSKQTGKKIPNSKLTKYSNKTLKKKIVNKVKINQNPKNYFDNALQTVKSLSINKLNCWLKTKYLYVYFDSYLLAGYADGPTQIKIKL